MLPAPRQSGVRIVGYRLLAADGGVFAFGSATQLTENLEPRDDLYVAMTTTAGGISVFVTATGLVATRPQSPFDGLAVETTAPIMDVDAPPSGEGFWVMDRSGGVFSFGDAGYHGSIPGLGLADPPAAAVALSSTLTGLGYWIVDMAGGVFSFGDAEFFGSTPAMRLEQSPAEAVDLAVSPTGEGYAVLERDGTIRGFGDVPELVRPDDGIRLNAVAFGSTSSPDSFIVVDDRGLVYPVGTAPMFGSVAHLGLQGGVVDVVITRDPRPSSQ